MEAGKYREDHPLQFLVNNASLLGSQIARPGPGIPVGLARPLPLGTEYLVWLQNNPSLRLCSHIDLSLKPWDSYPL